MRKRITDNNIFPVFSLKNEYEKIQGLLHFPRVIEAYDDLRLDYGYYSIDDALRILFLEWNLRGTFTSVDEMRGALGIGKSLEVIPITEEIMLDYIQFVLNAVRFVSDRIKNNNSLRIENESVFNSINSNCQFLLKKLGAETCEEEGEIFIVYCGDVATAVSNEHKNCAASITEYQKIDNRGDYNRKAEILCTLSKKLEPYESQIKSPLFDRLCNDTKFLLNKLARHEQYKDDPVSRIFREMSVNEKEQWCDKAFQLFLGCMAVVPCAEIMRDINALKKGGA